ncbi:MAG TPA: hypothetical protein VHK23_01640, partial [Miltoncostaeaceae bacterium]|nr:hypothetical protein [Miltoncostaeaceae bacterium]
MRARGRRWLAPAALGGAVLAALVVPAQAAKDDLDLISRATDGAPATGGASFFSDISPDGRFVAFISFATNLSDADGDLVIDAFLRDTATGTTSLVSRANGQTGAGGDDRTFIAKVSADGRYVAFDSDADNLSDIDDDTMADVFRRDTVTGATILVTREDGPDGTPASGAAPSISDDGRLIAFQSQDDTLSAIDDNVLLNLFVRDLDAGTTTLVSRPSGAGVTPQDASSFVPVVSGDGRSVAFESDANNLTADPTPASRDIFVRDLASGVVTLVSRATGPAGAAGDGRSTSASISADGRYVAFSSVAANLSAQDGDPTEDVFVRDLVAGTTTLVSRAAGPAGAGGSADSQFPSISDDGRYVAFPSEAANLSPIDDDALGDIFRRDVLGVPAAAQPGPVGPGAGARAGRAARCAGQRATIVGTARRDVLRGTRRRDVIASL